jgi:hypothetical protein
MICSVCKTKPVTIQGASTCSLRCATEACGDDPELVQKRLREQVQEVNNICISERERLQAEWRRANPGLMR